MPVEIRVPPLGESVVEATVLRWLKQEGQPVAAREAVVELETEKVNQEVAAEQAGVLQQIAKPEGETVHVGDVLGIVAEVAEDSEADAPASAPTAPEAPPARPAAAPAAPEAQPGAPAVTPDGGSVAA